jgi:cell division protein FtsI (penicillin-binding protein 3)/stage V sporulation protein D (sporulation-specific penicillin-binding protein)
MMRSAKVRMMAACFGLTAVFTAFSYRLVHLQVVEQEKYTELAADKHVNKEIIYAERGTIQDVNQEVLADNEPIKTVVADGSLVTNPAAVATVLAPALGMESDKIEEMISTDRRYIVLKKRVPESAVNDLQKLLRRESLRGISFVRDSARIYPNGSMLSHVLGYMDYTHQGMDGIEKSMDSYLRGHDGFRYTERDRTGKEIVLYRGQERPARAGCNVRLTIDMSLQNIVETELDAAVKQFKPKSAIVILMRPQTGEILALANRPNFDVNNIGDFPAEDRKNRAITDMVEPGSTFKIVTAAAALNEKFVNPDTMIFCENGHFAYAGKTLKDHDGRGYGDLSVDDILVKSSNIGAAKLAMMMGEQKFYEYIRRFGFGERTGVNLPGEINGQVHPPHQWTKISITRMPMGQGVGVTPMQTITAMSAIANGGHLMMPQIVHEIVDEQGATVASFPPVKIRDVVSEQVAAQVRDALKNVVSERGTAVLAKVAGFTVAGKTGTAQKVNPDGGGYLKDKYIVSFVGFLPAENPEFVGLVLLDDAKTTEELNYGGQVAAPIFSRIAEKAARYMNLEPHPEETPGIILTQSQR